jgi:hypothetical protein
MECKIIDGMNNIKFKYSITCERHNSVVLNGGNQFVAFLSFTSFGRYLPFLRIFELNLFVSAFFYFIFRGLSVVTIKN